MKIARNVAVLVALAALVGMVACSESKTATQNVPLSPTGGSGDGTTPAVTLTAPVPDSPADDAQTSLRPTFTVVNSTSSKPDGIRVYEFQVADNTNFTASESFSAYYVVLLNKTGVLEDSTGKTSYTPTADLQPTTRLYWRARCTQDGATSPWSTTRSIRTKITGYNRPGELYDPILYDETIGDRFGSTTFMGSKGIKINDKMSYVKYTLAQTISNGEFSVDVEGLYPNSPGAKSRIFSMMDGGSSLYGSNYLFNVQYRGVNGNPDNCISWKGMFGGGAVKLEPNANQRQAGVRIASPTQTYHWKATWGMEMRVTVYVGGITAQGALGSVVYELAQSAQGATYSPNPHTAYLGANDGGGPEDGSWAGAVYRNVWIGNRPRPAALGSAIDPQ